MRRVSGLARISNAIHDAALEPRAWSDAMAQVTALFGATCTSFYVLDTRIGRLRPIYLDGVDSTWVRNFDALYFTPDNPWWRLSARLHRPGLVRTNERLDAFARESGLLYRSQYYNDWMRPQQFRYTLGNTLLSEGGLIANVTLMRPARMPTFSAAEVRAFQHLTRDMTRALQVAARLEAAEVSRRDAHAALDALGFGVLLLDANGSVLHCNAFALRLLRAGDGIVTRHGRLEAADRRDARALDSLLGRVGDTQSAGPGSPVRVMLHRPAPRSVPLVARAVRSSGDYATLFAPVAATVVTIESAARPADAADRLRVLYGLTAAEVRLAAALADGGGMRAAAERAGVAYGTARVTLKSIFSKTGTQRQAQLVARLAAEGAPGVLPSD
jgi:DNA-binding CsgD family transcriptional regulator/PAS domain-containing protein